MFSSATFTFLRDLAAHNDRAWFEANKHRYEAEIREPAQAFIAAMVPALEKFAPQFRADPRRVGGSLMRVHRDTRFARDKTPYKTNVGIQFRHSLGKDVHAPGFYVHLSVDECFLGAGCWHPEAGALGRIRDLIAAEPRRWFATRDDAKLCKSWSFVGDSLSRPPRGYAAEHPAIEDIKRKDFLVLLPLAREEMLGAGLARLAAKRFAETEPLMRFLCRAVGVPY